MKKLNLIIILILIILMSACQFFLAPDPDNSPKGIFNAIWNDFNETYALFDVKGINWNAVYNQFYPQIRADMTDRELFNVCGNMLKVLDDSHVSLASPFAYINSGGWLDDSNNEPFSLDVVGTYLTGGGTKTENGMFMYGTFLSNPEIGYIFVRAFHNGDLVTGGSQDWTRAIDRIVQSLANTNSLVLDLRGNTGGLPSNVQYISSRFASVKRDYANVRTKNGPRRNDFSSPITFSINPDGSRYTKPIVLLTNRQTISGGEWFTLALLSQDHVTHAGGTTNGAFSLSLERPLINGWIYRVSVQIVEDKNGICHEGTGIIPEFAVTNTASELEIGVDKQLEFARDFLLE